MGVGAFGIIYTYLEISCCTWIVDLWCNSQSQNYAFLSDLKP